MTYEYIFLLSVGSFIASATTAHIFWIGIREARLQYDLLFALERLRQLGKKISCEDDPEYQSRCQFLLESSEHPEYVSWLPIIYVRVMKPFVGEPIVTNRADVRAILDRSSEYIGKRMQHYLLKETIVGLAISFLVTCLKALPKKETEQSVRSELTDVAFSQIWSVRSGHRTGSVAGCH